MSNVSEETSEINACNELDSAEKWRIAILLGIIFLIVCAPLIFKMSNSILGIVGLQTLDAKGNPNMFGWVIHMIAFILIVRILMK